MDLTGRHLGKYFILRRIGQGGMASVYLARDEIRGREIALKVLSPLVAENQTFLLRFRREARVVAHLDHPNIVPLEDFGEIDGYAYLAMPYVPESLGDRLARSPLSSAESARLIRQVASALEYAHARGVVHRDIKPTNILLDGEGDALLSDFGLAQIQDASISLTGSDVMGTPAYISPEQARGDAVDGRSDQYALGIILFQIATGKLPFQADTPMALLVKHAHESVPDPRQINPDVPALVGQVIRTATAKDPALRYASVVEMARSYEEALTRSGGNARDRVQTLRFPPGWVGRDEDRGVRHDAGRRRWLVRGAVALGLLILSSAGLYRGLISPSRGERSRSAMQLTALEQTIDALSTSVAASGGTLSPRQASTFAAARLTAAAIETTESSGTTPTGSTSRSTDTSAPTRAASTPSSPPTVTPTPSPPATATPPPTSTQEPSSTPLLPLPIPTLLGL